jgi:hypothetical protein
MQVSVDDVDTMLCGSVSPYDFPSSSYGGLLSISLRSSALDFDTRLVYLFLWRSTMGGWAAILRSVRFGVMGVALISAITFA